MEHGVVFNLAAAERIAERIDFHLIKTKFEANFGRVAEGALQLMFPSPELRQINNECIT